MTKRFPMLALCCSLLAACGGGGGDDVNAAAARTFTYGDAQPASSVPGAGDAIASITSFQGSGDEASAVAAQGALMQIAFESFDDDLGFGGFAARSVSPTALVREARSRTFAAALGSAATQFTNECTAVQSGAGGVTTVTFSNCQYTEVTTDGSLSVRASGEITGSPGAVEWDVRYTMTFSAPDATFTIAYHDVGDAALTPTTAKAHQEADLAATVSSGGQSAALGLAQSVDLDVTIAPDTCATNITGGTLQVKRVWTKRPSGATATELADRGALFTWNGCEADGGVVTVRFSR